MEISANTIRLVWGTFVALTGSAWTFLIGEWTEAHSILVTMMILDFCTGLLKGAYNKKLDSKVGYKGLIRKAGIIFAVIVANLADMVVNNDTPIFAVTVIFFYIAIEALSLLENLEAIGVPVPKKVKEFFVQMRKEKEKDDESTKEVKSEETDLYFLNEKVDGEDPFNENTPQEKSEK